MTDLQIEEERKASEIEAKQIKDAKKYLKDTDFKFTEDYDKKDTPEWLALKEERVKVRLFLRKHGY